MEKKLLSGFFIISLFLLASFNGYGQCPSAVTLTTDPGTNVCEGTPITFTANVTGGTLLTYQWEISGSVVGTDQTYTLNNPQQGQQVKVTVFSDGNNCTSRTSSSLVVNTKKTPTVGITPTKSTVCPGENVSFSASPTNQGQTPTYEWFINGSTVQQGSSSNLTNPAGLKEGVNTVKVIMTSSLSCVTSDKAEKTINYTVKPIATLEATTSTDTESCINTAITPIKFDIGGGGTGATVSGLPAGVSGSYSGGVYTISGSPTTAGAFNYIVNTTGTCAQTSATGSITVNPNATLSLTSGNNNQTVCAAGGVSDATIDPITYEIGETGTGVTVANLPSGITDSYSNGILTISGSSSEVGTHNYTVTATGDCGNSSTLNGSIIINENLVPSVSISSSDNEICAGKEVTFAATPTNGGTSPSYQWKIDGNPVGTNSSTFKTNALTDGQNVTVDMTSSETCLTTATSTSAPITTTVNPNLTPEVSIVSSDSDICPNDSVTFTATPVNGGATPTYQWKIGNTNVGTNSPTFTTSTLTDGQIVSVIMTSSETCLSSATATSNSIETNVNPDLIPSVTISSNDNNNIICSGSSITFTATPFNGGGNPSYQWKVGSNNVGTNSSSFTTSSLTNGQIVTVVMTASDDICLGDVTSATSNPIAIQVEQNISSAVPAFDNTNLSHNPTAICPSVAGLKYKVTPITGATSYDWSLPSGWSITNGAGTNEITVTANVNAAPGNITVNGRTECGATQSLSYAVNTGTAAHVGAGPDQTVCPGTTQITLAGEIGGVITQHKDWDWSASVNGAGFTSDGFSNGGNSLDGIYTIPTSARNGGTVIIRIQSVKPAGNCDIKTDEMTLKIQSAAAITDDSNKIQTVCLNSEITPISFAISGAGTGATTTGLPAGVSGSFESGVFTLSGTPTVAGTFNYTVTTTGNCTNASRTGTLTVNPRPTFTDPQDIFVCAGSNTSLISFTGSSVTGTTYQWTNDNTSIGLAASGTGNINSFTSSNSTNEPLVANISVTPVANNCAGTIQEFQITVYPTATFTKPENITVCNGENFGDIVFGGSTVSGTTYKWSNSITSIGLASEGTGNISSFSAVNTTNAPIEATITVTPVANGCDGTPEEFTITINPTPAFTAPENIVACNGEDLSQLDFTEATVTGTSFSWINNTPAIGLAASGTGNLPSFTAVNNGSQPVTATITVTPSANNCAGEPVTFDITVNPTAEVNNIDDVVICNGEDFSEIVLSSNVTGTSYSWTNSNPAIGLAGTGTGNIPAFTAENETNGPLTSTITVTPIANECEGTPYTFKITVNPSAIVNAGVDQTICSNGVATMAASLSGGATEGTWTTSGSGTFNNNSINAEYTPSDSDVLNGSVILTFTSNDPDGPCGATSDTLELIINEEVLITTEPQNIGVCSTGPSELTVIASGDNLTYVWKRTDGANILNSNGIYSSTLSFNNTTSINAGEYYVVVKGEDVCNDEDNPVKSTPVTITVDENIIIDEPSAEVPICGDGFSQATMKFIAHAGDSPLSFKWFKDGVEVDETDTKITIQDPFINTDGKYEGRLTITEVTVDYNGDYYVEITGPEEFTCSTAVTNPFLLRLNDIPADPEVEDLVVCQNETPEAFTVNLGTNLKWYVNQNDVEFITDGEGQPTAPVPATNIAGDFFYWVSQTPDVCESKRVQVKVTVKEKLPAPALTPAETVIEYCLGETPATLTAVDATGVLNWYDSETGDASTTAPTLNTSNPGETTYWVSQTPSDGLGCESDRAEITVTVFALPEVTASVEDAVICKGSPAALSATGGVSYIWYDGEEVIGNEASISHTPANAGDYTFTVVVTDSNGCENTADVNVQVDENTVAGTISGQESVCVTSPGGTLTLGVHTGDILRWESSEDGITWIEIVNNSETYTFSDLVTDTSFRAVVKNGVCGEVATESFEVTIDDLPAGGELNFAGVGRVFQICEGATDGYTDLSLTGFDGQISYWEYKTFSGQWTPIQDFQEATLTAAKIKALNLSETTAFRVAIINGSCSTPALSFSALLSVIPTDISPSDVSASPEVVCFGEEVTLSSDPGYPTFSVISEGGDFDNAGIVSDGWRFYNKKDPGDTGFDTDANNIQPDRWKRATPHPFTTATWTPYATGPQTWGSGIEDGNKGFAIVSSNNEATMETPVFNLGSMDEAIVTFDQAYNLSPGAYIKVEISSNGGNSYTDILYQKGPVSGEEGISSGNFADFGLGTIETRPENKIELDLSNYLPGTNLRIKFTYVGAKLGDIWAVDNIALPKGPQGIEMEWRDYTDPAAPDGILIGTNNSETYTPTEIGLNIFEVKTKLVYDSTGNVCEIAENSQRIEVFVFDTYTSTPTANSEPCEENFAEINAVINSSNQGNITSFPTDDGYVGQWEVIAGPDDYVFNASHFQPSITSTLATFSPVDNTKQPVIGNFTLRWVMTNEAFDSDGNAISLLEACPYNPVEITLFIGCPRLDFDGVDDYVDLGNSYTGTYSVEAWIRPEAGTGTIISLPKREINMEDLPQGTGEIEIGKRWYHIAVDSNGKLYVDGIDVGQQISTIGTENRAFIGAKWETSSPTNHFSGWIEEVRIWNGKIEQDQIRFLMNQRLQTGANIGVEIPMPAPGLGYDELVGYYQLIADPAKILNGGYTEDLSSSPVNGKLRNMTTLQENTAPLPYTSKADLVWSDRNTWTQPFVWDFPNSEGINGDPIEWNIVKTSNDITSGGKDITVLGLISESGELTIMDPSGSQNEYNSGQFLRVSHYLKLDGVIDLEGESQLLQDTGSIVDNSSAGYLDRDQQGKRNSFVYNYWSSPVSTTGSINNGGYTVSSILKDATTYTNIQDINFQDYHGAADGARSNPITISTYWLWAFTPATANEYAEWDHIKKDGSVRSGEGFTMKGTTGSAGINDEQNYTFRGKPHNGDINLSIGGNQNYLIGNPYPSAIDAHLFINEYGTGSNAVFDGAIYLWDHFKEVDHILKEYIGGYAVLNLTGGVKAVSIDERINDNLNESTKTPKQFIPVAQGFMINSTHPTSDAGLGGSFTLKNSYRVFEKESQGESIFLKPERPAQKQAKSSDFKKIRLSFSSPVGYHRQILVGAVPNATDAFDLGYDAHLFDDNIEDMYFLQGDNKLVIQAIADFNKGRVIPLGIKVKENKEFRIRLDTLENGNNELNIYLNDKLNDSIHDLRKSAYISTSVPGTIHDRFEILFHYEKELPVDPGPGEKDYGIVLRVRHSYANRQIQILNPDEIEISNLYLFDLNGNLLEDYSQLTNEKEIILPVRGYSSGVYIVKLYAKGKMITKKIILSN